MENHILFKTVVIGDVGVGKTSLVVRIVENQFCDPYYPSNIGLDFRTRTTDMDGEKIKFRLYDPPGIERFRTLIRPFYRGAHGVIIAFDITRLDSFDNLRSWIKDVEINDGDKMAKIIVGNKSDLKERAVSYQDAWDFADSMGIPYVETSAKTASNVEKAFTRLTADMKRMLDSGVFKMSVNSPVKLHEGRDLKAADRWPCVC